MVVLLLEFKLQCFGLVLRDAVVCFRVKIKFSASVRFGTLGTNRFLAIITEIRR